MANKRLSIYLSSANQVTLALHFGEDANMTQSINRVIGEWSANQTLAARCPICNAQLKLVADTGRVYCAGFIRTAAMPCDYTTTLAELTHDQQ